MAEGIERGKAVRGVLGESRLLPVLDSRRMLSAGAFASRVKRPTSIDLGWLHPPARGWMEAGKAD
jgi:hypothetical protein